MMATANISGYSANTPGNFMLIYSRQNISIFLPISSSNVALQARATLAVPFQSAEKEVIKMMYGNWLNYTKNTL